MALLIDIALAYLSIGVLLMIPLSRYGRDLPFSWEAALVLLAWPMILWGRS